MKEKYLKELELKLKQYQINVDELEDIINDYSQIIDEELAKNKSEEKILKKIGTPTKVINDLVVELKKGEDFIYFPKKDNVNQQQRNIIIAITPIATLIIFLVMGFGFGWWHPGWLIFSLIPMAAIIVNSFEKDSLDGYLALSPFVALIVFLILGFGYNLWHPGWLVFIIVPILGVFIGYRQMGLIEFLTTLSPYVCLIIYVLIGTYSGKWIPYWVVFMMIPMIAILGENKLWKKIIMELSFLFAIFAYIYAGYNLGNWWLSLLFFLIPTVTSILISEGIHFEKN